MFCGNCLFNISSNSFAACNLTSDGAGNLCGWATGGVTCKAKQCTDSIPTPNATTCSAYISTCAFNGVSCSPAGQCSSYSKNTFALCNATTDGAGNSCGWSSGANCKIKACTDSIPSPSAAICSAYLSTCAFNGTNCVVPTACTSYALNSFALCNATTDGAGNACGWSSGGFCKVKACSDSITSPSAVNCVAYIPSCSFDGTSCFIAGACSTYVLNTFALCNATNDAAGNACGWITGGTTCKSKACTDTVPTPSAATCTAYLSRCGFNGSICVVASSCTMYALNNFADCKVTTDGAGNYCGWVTAGINCKARECTDSIATPSAAICTAYLSTCAFNGTICVVASACTSYALPSYPSCALTTDGASNFCGWATGGVNCKAKGCTDPVPTPTAAICTAYLSSCAFNGTVCAAAASCSTYALATFALCNATNDGAGNSCGWATGGAACKIKSCTDAIPSPSVVNC